MKQLDLLLICILSVTLLVSKLLNRSYWYVLYKFQKSQARSFSPRKYEGKTSENITSVKTSRSSDNGRENDHTVSFESESKPSNILNKLKNDKSLDSNSTKLTTSRYYYAEYEWDSEYSDSEIDGQIFTTKCVHYSITHFNQST